jgi:hypothetical protein
LSYVLGGCSQEVFKLRRGEFSNYSSLLGYVLCEFLFELVQSFFYIKSALITNLPFLKRYLISLLLLSSISFSLPSSLCQMF